MCRLRFYPIPLALVCCLWLAPFSGCGVVQECITGKDCPVKYTCQNGTCLAQTDPCAATGGTSCGSACVDLRTNNDHCGTCGTKCGVGSTCQNGQCKPIVPPLCASDSDCLAGQVCQNGQCKSVSCTKDGDCADGQACLNGQCLGNKVDILFVIDNSGSMKEEQDRLLANISAFFAKLQQSKIDFQVAVLTTDVDKVFNAGGWGRFVQADSSTPKIISSSLPSAQIEAAFRKNANVGTKGSNFERPLEAIQIALSPSSAGGFVDTVNKGFLRSGAALAIFILSDEDDCSHEGMLDEHRASDTCYVPASVTLTDDQGNPLIGPNGMPEKGQMDKLASVSKYTQFLKRLNRKIILSGLIGNPFIYKPGTQTPIDPPTGCTQDNQCGSQGAQCRYQTNSPVTKKCGGCQSTDTSAIGGFRLFEAVSQIHPNNPEQYVFPICGDATAYSFALSEFANKIAQVNSPSPTCTQNSDCSSGLVCINGQCRPHVTPCSSNMDCAAGQSCQNGQCK